MRFRFLCLGILFCVMAFAQKNTNSAKIIFDTDMGPDYDDVGALAILHAMADNGEADILATVSSNCYENAAPCIDVLNRYFGRAKLPIGAPKKGENIVDPRFVGKEYWAEELPKRYPHKIKSTSEATDAVEVYRKILSRQPDKSVTIVTVGFLTNLAHLLESSPDKYSKLTGSELVKQKVKHLVSMAGFFPKGREFNVIIDSTASVKTFSEWPTPIYISGFQIGEKILTGKRLIASNIENSPVKDAFDICLKIDVDGRCSWDQTAVLVAVRGYEPYFNVEKGTMTVLPNGDNSWKSDANGLHYQLLWKKTPEEITDVIETLMMHQPRIKKK